MRTKIFTLLILLVIVSVASSFFIITKQEHRQETTRKYLQREQNELRNCIDFAFGILPYIDQAVDLKDNDNMTVILDKMILARNGVVCRHFAPILFAELISHGYNCYLEAGVFYPKYDPDSPSTTFILFLNKDGFYECNHVWVRNENGEVLDYWNGGRYYTYLSIDVEFEERVWSIGGNVYIENLVWEGEGVGYVQTDY